MRLKDVVRFREDLLFDGAVQLGWFEGNRELAETAAEHYVFHGPRYHGVTEQDLGGSPHALMDTASFTLSLLEHVYGTDDEDPFTMAIAGYGAGKSHLAITIACLLDNPSSVIAETILDNLSMADEAIGKRAKDLLGVSDKPFLVVALNGMQDFDLTAEISRQALRALNQRGLDTSALQNLRPRFKTAISFTESFADILTDEFALAFGEGYVVDQIIESLHSQDDGVFRKVNSIYQQKMGSPIPAVGQESLHDFIRVTKETYCGPGKYFAGIVIIFDEFGRYLEFSVQKPHIAGPGALQQLFECVQAHRDGVFLLSFIQYELKAYIARMAPELREDVNRYVTRYDVVHRVRLSTNLETLIANLLEKKDESALERHSAEVRRSLKEVFSSMHRWFPDMRNYALWTDEERFLRVVGKGCWPLHPCSTWTLFRLTSVGRSLQHRSALSLLADVYRYMKNVELEPGPVINPADLCNQTLINEFLASERFGVHGASATGYESVISRYQTELIDNEILVLKSVVLASKIAIKVESKQDYLQALAMLSGLGTHAVDVAVDSLEREYAVLEWNGLLNQFEIAGDAVPRRTFLAQLQARAADIHTTTSAYVFTQKGFEWELVREMYNTEFGAENRISTREWNYKVYLASVPTLEGQLREAINAWRNSISVDAEKGQLIYCYVGVDSNLDAIKEKTDRILHSLLDELDLSLEPGLPVAVLFLDDKNGELGRKISEYWVLEQMMGEEESRRYIQFISDRQPTVLQEMNNLIAQFERERHIVAATPMPLEGSRLMNMLMSLFDRVYPSRMPFPFDGFHTARGNAAKDCQSFTKELFLGNLDRDWIAARSTQQRNRAFQVLDKAWGLIDADGTLRKVPSEKAVRDIIELLEDKLSKDANAPLNLGKALELLCAPPYGCNIASAGLLLAYLVGKRKDEVQLYYNKAAVAINKWLQDAMPGDFLSVTVLEATDVIRVSEEVVSEWEILLQNWESEPTLVGKVDFLKQARQLTERIPLPRPLFYRYELAKNRAEDAGAALIAYEKELDDALEKFHRGSEGGNYSLLAWGAASLARLYNQMKRMSEQWTSEQLLEVENYCAKARQESKSGFAAWLPRQKVLSSEELGKFKHHMLKNMSGNLLDLGLEDENKQLEAHVAAIESRIDLLTILSKTVSDIHDMVGNCRITDASKVSVLNDWLDQASELAGRLEQARDLTDVAAEDIYAAAKELRDLQQACEAQLEAHRKKTSDIYNIRELDSLSRIANWRNEVAALISVYEGQELDVEDLRAVQTQLDMVEEHYKLLDDVTLSEDDFASLIKECKEENDAAFADDVPPLDNDQIYKGMKDVLAQKRSRVADEWMRINVPHLEDIQQADASDAAAYQMKLLKMPLVLSGKQRNEVNSVLEACEKRLGELQVGGALAQFEALPEEGKALFLTQIWDYVEKQYQKMLRSSS